MSAKEENPFERFDLDPKEGAAGITERLRELAEEAGEEERAAIRQAWEELTLHPLRRLRAALFAFPPHPEAWQTTPRHAPSSLSRNPSREPLTFAEVSPRPSVKEALARALVVPPNERAQASSNHQTLDEDPVLAFRTKNTGYSNQNPSMEKKR